MAIRCIIIIITITIIIIMIIIITIIKIIIIIIIIIIIVIIIPLFIHVPQRSLKISLKHERALNTGKIFHKIFKMIKILNGAYLHSHSVKFTWEVNWRH